MVLLHNFVAGHGISKTEQLHETRSKVFDLTCATFSNTMASFTYSFLVHECSTDKQKSTKFC